MGLADFLYGALLIAVVLAVIGIFLFARSMRRNFQTPSERLFIMTFGLLLGVALLFAFLHNHINSFRNDGEPEIDNTPQQEFVQTIYPPLGTAQQRLSLHIDQLNKQLEAIIELRNAHPQQRELLDYSYQVWLAERKRMSQLRQSIDTSVRNAWFHHQTADKQHVRTEFNRRAVELEKLIDDRIRLSEDSQLRINERLLDNINRQRQMLRQVRASGKAGAGRNFGRSAFKSGTKQLLSEYLSERDETLGEILAEFDNELRQADQRRHKVKLFATEHPDLKDTLDQVQSRWLDFEGRGRYFRDQVLHGLQAEFLAIKLGLNPRHTQMRKLSNSIKARVPELYNDLRKQRIALDRSYKTTQR